jgi:hypothetical protein
MACRGLSRRKVKLFLSVRDEWRMSRPDRWTLQAEHGQYGGEGVRKDESAGRHERAAD